MGNPGAIRRFGMLTSAVVERPSRPPSAADLTRPDLEQVFRSEYSRVLAVARRVLGPGPQAEDVAQDVFIAFGRASVPRDQARGWLTVAAAHTALNSLRSESRRARRESAAAQRDQVADVAEQVIVAQGRTRVRQALARLPRKQALVVVLRHSGMSYQEVGAALGMSPGSVGTTLRRAEAAVRKEFEGDESPL